MSALWSSRNCQGRAGMSQLWGKHPAPSAGEGVASLSRIAIGVLVGVASLFGLVFLLAWQHNHQRRQSSLSTTIPGHDEPGPGQGNFRCCQARFLATPSRGDPFNENFSRIFIDPQHLVVVAPGTTRAG